MSPVPFVATAISTAQLMSMLEAAFPEAEERLKVLNTITTSFQMATDLATMTIESEAHPVELDGYRWYDTRPMLDARQHAPEVIALHVRDLDFAFSVGLYRAHNEQPHLVRAIDQ